MREHTVRFLSALANWLIVVVILGVLVTAIVLANTVWVDHRTDAQIQHDTYVQLSHDRAQCESTGGSFRFDPNWIPNYLCVFDSK